MPLVDVPKLPFTPNDDNHRSSPEIHYLRLSQSKLKASSNTSTLLVGFAMVALVEFDLRSPSGDDQKSIGTFWLIVFGICTALLISVHLIALIISTCILPQMNTISIDHLPRSEQPYNRFHFFVESAWILSTIFGLFLFFIEISVMCLIKFGAVENMIAGYSTLAVLGPAAMIFVFFSYYFYRVLYKHKIAMVAGRMLDLERSYQSLEQMYERVSSRRSSISGIVMIEGMKQSASVPAIVINGP